MKRKHNRGVKETRTGGTTPLGPGRTGPAVEAGRGGGGWFEKWRRKDVNQKREPTGVNRGILN